MGGFVELVLIMPVFGTLILLKPRTVGGSLGSGSGDLLL